MYNIRVNNDRHALRGKKRKKRRRKNQGGTEKKRERERKMRRATGIRRGYRAFLCLQSELAHCCACDVNYRTDTVNFSTLQYRRVCGSERCLML